MFMVYVYMSMIFLRFTKGYSFFFASFFLSFQEWPKSFQEVYSQKKEFAFLDANSFL